MTSPLGKSDHGCVTIECDIEIQERKCKKIIYLYEKADYRKLRRLRRINWDDFLNTSEIEEMWERFKKKMVEAINLCIPQREFKDSNRLHSGKGQIKTW